MSGLSPYPGPDERERELERLAAAAGAQVVEIGRSHRGLPIRAARVPSSGSGERPAVLCCANIHGPELVGSRVALGLLERLARPEGELARLREAATIWVLPCINVDGYARTVERGGEGRLAELRTNEAGVDLNRNFPIPPGHRPSRLPTAGSSRKGAATYRGEAPLSEPEARAVDALCREQRFHASVGLHSFMGTLITPRLPDRAEYRAYDGLCRAFRRGQRRWRYVRFASRIFDVFTGELEDHQHHAHRTWATCVEVFPVLSSFRQHLIAPSLFWRFNPRDPAPFVDNDVPGIAAYFLEALSRSRP